MESECKRAAAELNLTWEYNWSEPSEPPGCIVDVFDKVFFNTALNATELSRKFDEICTTTGELLNASKRLVIPKNNL